MKRTKSVTEAESPAKVAKKQKTDKVKAKPNQNKQKPTVAVDGKHSKADDKKVKLTKNSKPSNGVTKKSFKPKKTFGNKTDKGKGKTAPEVSKPPDWAQYKKDKKQLRDKRRNAGFEEDTLDVVNKAKVVSEQFRRKNLTPEQHSKLAQELHSMLNRNNHYKQLALAHDTTRIIQWLLKYSSPQIREEISKQLMKLVPEMILSMYARNCVKRILKYGSESTRDSVINTLHGQIIKFASHAMSAPILGYIYSDIASKKQKQYMQQEFYGDIYKTSKDDSVVYLKDTYKGNPEMKNAMLGATKANILKALNKNVHDSGLIHAVLFEYLKECNSTDRSELITTLSPLVAPLSNSKEGVKAAVMCVWHGTTKDKKIIIKVVKEHALSLATHEHGHLLILSILASVDDTVLVNKVLLSALLTEVNNIAKEEWGRKVLLWLVAPRDTIYFHPSLVKWLDTGITQGNSKKPADQKSAELLKDALPSICESLQSNTAFWLSGSCLSLTTTAILKSASGELLQSTLDSVAEFVCTTPWTLTEDDKEINGIEHAGIHLSLKKLAQYDKVNTEKGEYTFGQAICKFLKEDTARFWVTTNRGCFLLVTLYENNSLDVQKSLKEILASSEKVLKKQSMAGSKILLKKMNG